MGGNQGFQKLLAYLSIGWSGICILLWGSMILFAHSWHEKFTLYYCLEFGLFSVKVSEGVIQALVGMVFERLAPETVAGLQQTMFEMVNHELDMQDFTQRMCAPAMMVPGLSRACGIQTQVMWGSWGLIFFVGTGCIFLMLGIGFQWYYFFERARRITRLWYRAFYVVAAILITIGMSGYCIATRNIQDFPPMLTSGAHWAGGNSTILAMMLTLMCWVPMIISIGCLGESIDETMNENLSEHKKFETGEQMYGVFKPYHETAGVSSGAGAGSGAFASSQGPDPYQQQMPAYQQQPYSAGQASYSTTATAAGSSQGWQTGYSSGPQSGGMPQAAPTFQGQPAPAW